MHCTAKRKQCQPQALGHSSPGEPQGTWPWKQIWSMCERSGAPFKLFLHTNSGCREEGASWPWRSLRRPDSTPPEVLHMQCWQHPLWGTELYIQPSMSIYHSLSSPLQGGLQFWCQACYLVFISIFVQSLTGYGAFHLLVTDAFLSGLCSSNYLSLWRIHFPLYSHPVQSPLSSIPFPKMHHLPSASSSDLFL